MDSKQRGFTLVEVLVAVALAAGPVLLALGLIDSNVKGARFNVERATARMVVVELSELLMGETIEALREATTVPGRLDQILSDRIGRMPPAVRTQYREQAASLSGKLCCSLDERAGGLAGLVRLTLWVDGAAGRSVHVARIFRPDARTLPPVAVRR